MTHPLRHRLPLPITLLALGLLSGAPLAAQSHVSPLHFEVAEADSGNLFPFGNGSTFRYQQIHDDLQHGPQTLQAIAFRRDGSGVWPSNVSYAGFTIELEMWVSTAAFDSKTLQFDFANNHGLDKQRVVSRRSVYLPPTHPGAVPEAFDYEFKFDQPFAFGGAAPLCWECIVYSSRATQPVYFDSTRFPAPNPPLAIQSYGEGCRFSGRSQPLAFSAISSMDWPKNRGLLRMRIQEAQAQTGVALLIGASDQQLGPFPLPILFPGTTNAPSGPCTLYIAPLLTELIATDTSGAATLDWNIGVDPSLNGLRIFLQVVGADPAANPSGLVLSNVSCVNWVAPILPQPVARLYSFATQATSGIPMSGTGLVTRFR
jgi:hypothetical protein